MNEKATTLTEKNGLPKLGFSRHEAAEILGVSVESLDALTKRGLLRPSRALRRPIYTLKELSRYLDDTQ